MDLDHAAVAHIARLARFCAVLYRTVPLEGHGLLGQAQELAHAAYLEHAAAAENAREMLAAVTPRDIQITCQLLIEVRREPNRLHPNAVELVRHSFPEVEAENLDPLERLVHFFVSLIPRS
jgi:hypothetical protein